MNNGENKQSNSDFEVAAFLKEKTTRHDRDISDIKKRLSTIEKRTSSNESFAKSFSDSLNTQTVASDALVTTFCKFIDSNSKVQETLKRFVRSDHIHNIVSFLKSFGGALFWVIVGALITYFVPKLFGGD